MNAPHTPAHVIIDDFLPEQDAADLLAFALENRTAFEPAVVVRDGDVLAEKDNRSAMTSTDLGPMRSTFTAAVEAHFEHLCKGIGLAPFGISGWDMSLAVHRDGDFFSEHIDTLTAENRDTLPGDRLISMVYYMHLPGARFEGGELVVRHLFGRTEPVRIAPRHNRLVAFPSIAPHAVEPVRVPGNAWEDARFSVNCWLLRGRG
ncbi:2OG-Fe(II) oxygenase [Erythrobacter litoralis]|uniref:Fe2OG dioxygenase domain-containing protein n=1 Tax=Erythrobacter litoralis (strain HTCC2594) TaxID=314225 RepID=Q2N914_ERYLH|nr:2OG-Fe(II) oxygenase [Erythrobacter litoralis]ABC63827.1 hypothetical protein ELI_08675 [Erythrobacter litoralis HTCC2594]